MKIKKWRQLFWQGRGVLTITPSVAAAVVLLRSIGLLQSWEWAAFDQYMRLHPPERPDSRVVIVGVNEDDLTALNQALVSDKVLAEAIAKIKAASPRAIGLDIYRDLPIEPGNEALTHIFKTTPNLVGIRKVVGKSGQDTVAGPPGLEQIGANDLIPDADNTVRRGPIWIKDADGNTVYSFSFYLALLYLEAEAISPKEVEQDVWWLGETLFKPFEKNNGGYVGADAGGYQQIIRYRGPTNSFEIVSLMDILSDRVGPNWAKDKVVLIGAVSESSNDSFYTPHSSTLLSVPEVMSGVEVHANLTSQFISAAIDGRPIIKSWPEWAEWAWILLWATTGSLLVWQFNHSSHPQNKLWQKSSIVLAATATLAATTYLPFLFGWWLPVIPSLLAATGSATAIMAYLARSANDIRRTFGRYLSDEIVTTLLENPEGQKLGGDRRKITILTSDLRGFTATSERLPPETVIKVLNFYLGCMADVITRHNGTIDEFMGDGILILFGAPIRRENDAQRAVACAVDMQLAMEKVNATMQAWNLEPLEMGIGIHTGEVVVGNIGSEKRTKYGIVGAPVNLTYRIESFTTGGQILISQETLNAAAPIAQIRGEQIVKPKGVAQPITIFDVGGVGEPYNLALQSQEEHFVALASPIKASFSVLDGKHIDKTTTEGYLIELSEKGALLQLHRAEKETLSPPTLLPLSNLKLNLELDIASEKSTRESANQTVYSEDTYAKVIEQTPAADVFRIHFTAKPPAVAKQLNKRLETPSGHQAAA
ncbi:MAG: CHASE2 domain-containing protein [Phormidesmis sp.]